MDKVGNFTTEKVAYIVLEFIENGELYDFINIQRFDPPIARYYFKEMLNVLEFLHENGVVHRDLKMENFMLDHDFKLKLIDYGMAAPINGWTGNGLLYTRKGTPQYMAPELLA